MTRTGFLNWVNVGQGIQGGLGGARPPQPGRVPSWGNSFIAFVAPPPTAVTMFPPPDFQATSNEVHPSWLNPLKLNAWRCFGCGGVNLVTDSGGDRAFSPYKI